jgi:hypothetical protein
MIGVSSQVFNRDRGLIQNSLEQIGLRRFDPDQSAENARQIHPVRKTAGGWVRCSTPSRTLARQALRITVTVHLIDPACVS